MANLIAKTKVTLKDGSEKTVEFDLLKHLFGESFQANIPNHGVQNVAVADLVIEVRSEKAAK